MEFRFMVYKYTKIYIREDHPLLYDKIIKYASKSFKKSWALNIYGFVDFTPQLTILDIKTYVITFLFSSLSYQTFNLKKTRNDKEIRMESSYYFK